jgi:FHS family L-fucose permease-like MFS transporter
VAGALQSLPDRMADARAVQMPYFGIAVVLLGILGLIWIARLPNFTTGEEARTEVQGVGLFGHKMLVTGIMAIFIYVGGEVSIGSFLISYIASPHIGHMTTAAAAGYLSFYWGGAALGRFVGALVLRYVPPSKMLADNCVAAVFLIGLSMAAHGPLAMWGLLLVGLCNSIMFPTIFTLAIRGLGPLTGRGSGYLVMAICGGAVVPMIQAAVADMAGLTVSFVVPLACYIFIWLFAQQNYERQPEGAVSA